eukprot:CAMPEP_0170776110 /NCGR_PEP_ID=MMETSP0733-20121128/10970_1 /TAXON_ID=186038 /ORGANISM="Fragilariopsis kerguelensis, Strain L26-C5" /LENGTH=56 /DNA_ID=CAMNT_0011119019 /DNA_START=132 /DNA_END=299 /DNA_ORIENTATION=+
MTCQTAGAVVSIGTDSNPGAVCRQRHRNPGGLAINVTSQLGPRAVVHQLEYPGMTC